MFFADEWLVKKSSEDSNYHLTEKHFLHPLVEGRFLPSLVYTVDEHLIGTPTEAAADYAQRLADAVQDERFDLLLLGMGDDGDCCCLTDFLAAPHHRTFTLPFIHKARNVLFVVTGEKKSRMVKTVLEEPSQQLPSTLTWPD